MKRTRIEDLVAWEALDSRGMPTVAACIRLADGSEGHATAPAGASTGVGEAREVRDGGDRYGGAGVRRAVAAVRDLLRPAVLGLDAADGRTVDGALREADGSAGLARLGANAVLPVSVAARIAAARAAGVPLFEFVRGEGAQPVLPLPMVNVLSGGAHAGRVLDIQDVMVVPVGATSFAEAIELVWRVRSATAELLTRRGYSAALVADEGGFGPPLAGNEEALEVVTRGIEDAGLRPGDDVALAVDVAASQFATGAGRYLLSNERREVSAPELIDEIAGWSARYPLVSIEDPLAEDDWAGWCAARKRLGHVQTVGDDLLVTDPARVARGIEAGVANAVLVKPNQVGTLSDALDVIHLAADAGWATVLSARSGDTEEAWLADLAVGWGTGQIKVGSLARSERTAKWNRLLRIEQQRCSDIEYAGGRVLVRGKNRDE